MSITDNKKLFTSNREDWLTPPLIIKLVKKVFGDEGIYLDPCADKGLNIPADIYYYKNQNGLLQVWHHNVYVNPPYGRQIGKWTKKAVSEFLGDPSINVIILLPARMDTRWFQGLINNTSPLNRVCLWKGRLHFRVPGYTGETTGAPFPSCIVLLSHNVNYLRMFEKVFGYYGLIVEKILAKKEITTKEDRIVVGVPLTFEDLV